MGVTELTPDIIGIVGGLSALKYLGGMSPMTHPWADNSMAEDCDIAERLHNHEHQIGIVLDMIDNFRE